MRRADSFFLNTLILTASSLLMRMIGIGFQSWLTSRIGPAGMGLHMLILSVGGFAISLALSGARFTATRLVSEEMSRGDLNGASAAMRTCSLYAASFGTASALLLYMLAPHIGASVIGDVRTVRALRIMAVSMPFLSVSSVLSGYFTAVSRVARSSAAAIFEQLVRIAAAAMFIMNTPAGDVGGACAGIAAGGAAGEASSFFLLLAMYLSDRSRYGKTGRAPKGMTRRVLTTAFPLALSSYARTGIATVQNLLVPRGLERSGSTARQALSGYGVIQGMAFPVLTFPSAFFYAVAEMLVPEMTEAQINGRGDVIAEKAGRILRMSRLLSCAVAGAVRL